MIKALQERTLQSAYEKANAIYYRILSVKLQKIGFFPLWSYGHAYNLRLQIDPAKLYN